VALHRGGTGAGHGGGTAALPTPTLLGKPDFNGYCQATGQGSVTLVAADRAYGWHCAQATSTGDDANAVCAWTYRLSASEVTNSVTNFNDPYSWQCWRAHRQVSAPSWNGYCAMKGWGGAYLSGNDAYGWHCTGSSSGLDAGAVCGWTNNASSLVVGRFQDFYDPSSWQCWV
jgi:hypothetical protein